MQESRLKSMFITWEEAQRLRPILKRLGEEGPYAEVRRSAKDLYRELGNVKKINYAPFPGHQLLLNKYDRRVIDVVMESLED